LFAVTLGLSCERWLKKISLLSPAKHFLADALASAYAEAAAELADTILSKDLDTAPRFSPGYGDLPLSIQKDLICLTEANKYLHIDMQDSFLMIPQKSITAIIGIKNSAEGD
jgi:cobalamin-dependent methionine synthase I